MRVVRAILWCSGAPRAMGPPSVNPPPTWPLPPQWSGVRYGIATSIPAPGHQYGQYNTPSSHAEVGAQIVRYVVDDELLALPGELNLQKWLNAGWKLDVGGPTTTETSMTVVALKYEIDEETDAKLDAMKMSCPPGASR